jgi:hypothetical protein
MEIVKREDEKREMIAAPKSKEFLEQCVKKILKMRGAWDVFFKIQPPATPERPYSIVLEKGTASEQILLSQKDVARSEASGTDIFVSTDIRTGLRHLEKRAARRPTRFAK